MSEVRPSDHRDEEYWREFLTNPDSIMAFGRRVLSHLPANPRCRLCAAPFSGVGRPVMLMIGKRQSLANPNMCNTCESHLLKHRGGAEVMGSMLFADIRGSTALAESMPSHDFRNLLDRFYTVAAKSVFDHDGIVDKFVGDELVAVFPPMLSPRHHAGRAVDAARAVLRGTGHGDPDGPWAPVGAGVHTGSAWFGAVGEGDHVELAIIGDAVNTAARLAAAAGAGEILVSAAAAEAAGLDPALERQQLALKGKQGVTEVVTVRLQ